MFKLRALSCLFALITLLAVATTNISAISEREDGARLDSEIKVNCNRYYFYMPEDWENEHSSEVGVYWWEGTDSCGDNWPGYKANKTDIEGLFYYDVPKDVTKIIWNNLLDDGTGAEDSRYSEAKQTININCQNYKPNDSSMYPEGVDSFDGMVYVIDYDDIDIISWDFSIRGEWYYYYGNGEYGKNPQKTDLYFTERQFGTIPNGELPDNKPKPTVPKMTIFFVNSIKWENVYIHYYTNYGYGGSNSVPGDEMELLYVNDELNEVYSFDVPIDVFGIVFSDGKEKTHDVTNNLVDLSVFEITKKLDEKWLYRTYEIPGAGKMIGDTNMDCKVTVKDATLIQKHLVGIATLTNSKLKLSDADKNLKVNIKDATVIQKYIAKIKVEAPIGNTIE